MISEKIKITLFLLILGIFCFFIYSTVTKHEVSDKEQKIQKDVSGINITELPKFIYGIKKMVLIHSGTFLMGDENSNFSDERPAHFVTIDSFYMDETPVTNEDFKKYVEAGGAKSRYWRPGYVGYDHPEKPVVGINWYHAIDYCNWRSKIRGLSPAYKLTDKLDAWGYPLWKLDKSVGNYRLPTEAEFEYAARGGLEQKQFPWGDEFNPSLANFDDERGIMKGDWWRLARVKDAPPNNFGLYGMNGNIWHWTNDWYDPNYYAKSSKNNLVSPEIGRTKALRGGSWGSIDLDYLRVAKRSWTAPSNYNYDIGFRCVLLVREETLDSILNQDIRERKITHKFYKYKTAHYVNPLQINPYSEEFINRLTQYISDHYPESIYFQTKIDEQEIINPREMAGLIVETTKEHRIHPLFLTGIMASESGFGTVSFPRWYNSPMAYHWQNVLMKKGLPIYEPILGRNRKYKDLKSAFRVFAKGIRRDIYIKAAQKDLDAFHLLYVGYQAEEWMYTISRVYKDVMGIRLEPHFPVKNVGQYIFTDWEILTPINSLNVINKIVSWGHEIPSSPRSIDTIIIHSSYNTLGDDPYSVNGVIQQYKTYGVSSHYLIDRNGTIYRLVEEKNIAYHAGKSKMPDGRTNINNFSMGITLINTKSVGPNEVQYTSLLKLVRFLKWQYEIKNILGHNQIAPDRKTDPWNFNWQKFNEMLKN